jgi:hypothetical protein
MVALPLTGCKKSQPEAEKATASAVEQTPEPPSTNPAQPQPVSAAPDSPAAVATGPRPANAPVVPIVLSDPGNAEKALADLTQALRKYSFENRRMPKTFSEVIAAGYVQPVPQPPPGKKFEIDPKTKQVVLMKQ